MFALIMAGGKGKRFWPKSREKRPKQLLKIFGERTMIQSTVDRLLPAIPENRIFVVTTEGQTALLKKQLPGLSTKNFIVEPKGKNTAPCIGLAALFMEKIDPNGVMAVFPADHLITNQDALLQTLKVGAKIASERDCLVTLGIEPVYPATGYGYIQFNDDLGKLDGIEVLRVKTFAEKPNLATAERFLSSGDFLWNSGMFIWKIKTILKAIEEYLPHLHDGLMEIREDIGTRKEAETINRVYCQIKSISIDYGVMEQALDVVVLKGPFGWNDMGSWDEVYKYSSKDENENVLLGDHLLKDSRGNYVDVPKKCVAIIGIDNLVVVDTGDALLICPRERAQEVQEIVELAHRRKMNHLL
ncbi:MAG TPA: mannose-1-phosphate guanylyltransferase [bacterium]